MYKLAKPFFLMCETPLHAGSGTDLGIIDMPIQRERHTGFPKVEGSGLKGCLRERFDALKNDSQGIVFKGKTLNEKDIDQCVNIIFGPNKGGDYAAALGITDARVLLFPVKSVRGVYAWVTCPYVLEKFINELSLCGIKELGFKVPQARSTPKGSSLFVRENRVVLEEYTFEIDHKDDDNCTALAEWLADKIVPDTEEYKVIKEKMSKDILVLTDDEFKDFVQWSTEVITRTKIDATGTVAEGALFTEEYLPAETVLYALALAAPVFAKDKGILDDGDATTVMEFFQAFLPEVIQIGGDATIGKGITRVAKKLLEVESQ